MMDFNSEIIDFKPIITPSTVSQRYVGNPLIQMVYHKMKYDINCEVTDDREKETALDLNMRVLDFLAELHISQIYPSLTASESLHYRFSTDGNNYEFKLETFYKDLESDNFSAIIHIYENGIKQGSYYGSLEEMFSRIENLANSNCVAPNFYAFNKDIKNIAGSYYANPVLSYPFGSI